MAIVTVAVKVSVKVTVKWQWRYILISAVYIDLKQRSLYTVQVS